MKKIASNIALVLICHSVFGADSSGWENANPERAMPSPVKEVWCAPFDKGVRAFRVEWQRGATGTVSVKNGALRIEKSNARGMVVVELAEPFTVKSGLLLQGYAACFNETPADPYEAKAYIRMWSGERPANWKQWDYGLFAKAATESPAFTQLVNAPPGQFTRKLCRVRVGESGKVTAAIVVEGSPSVTVWRGWGAEDAEPADKAWRRRAVSERKAPDRSGSLIDESAFDAAVLADREHSARMVKTAGGAVLEVDGKVAPPILYKPRPFGHGEPFTSDARAFDAAGIRLQSFGIRLGEGANCPGFWTKNGFDCAGALACVKKFMRSAPDSLFVVTIHCDAYPEYSSEHPEEVWMRPDGTVVFGGNVHAEKNAPSKKSPNTWPWVSNHSLVWRRDVKRIMTDFIGGLKRTGLSKRIVGFHLAGYHDGQFALRVADVSKPALAAFREWQRKEYGKVRWNSAPQFPDKVLMLDPVKDEAQIAFQKFLKWAPMDMQDDFADHLKKQFGKPIVVGRWAMSAFGGGISATVDFTPFTRSRSMDFLVTQPHYHLRIPGIACNVRPPLDSFRKNAKMFLNELDLRTWHGQGGAPEARAVYLSEAQDLPMWKTIHRRLAGQMLANRMGWWYFDMQDNWFADKGIMDDIASVRRLADGMASIEVKSPWRPSAMVVVDEEGLMFRNRSYVRAAEREAKSTNMQMEDLSAASVPYETMLAQDLIDDIECIGACRIAVMCGFYNIDRKRRELIAGLKRRGVQLVFLADSGACGGADACEGSLCITKPRGLTPRMFNSLVGKSGGYVPAPPGLQVDMNGDFVSVHCLKTGIYDFILPFAADVQNVKTGERFKAVKSISLDFTGGETRWFSLRRLDKERNKR
jgi:hypothetical protein